MNDELYVGMYEDFIDYIYTINKEGHAYVYDKRHSKENKNWQGF